LVGLAAIFQGFSGGVVASFLPDIDDGFELTDPLTPRFFNR
jgi:hypothetical protein